MNDTAIEYSINPAQGIVNHGWISAMLFRDGADKGHHTLRELYELEAQIKSGDYFITLATKLDAMGREVEDYSIKSQLEDIVSDLIHLQDHYDIIQSRE